ncbi:hypothetical protein DM02DRAFT_704321 [Periconia macrospinosa]|uniref:Uncharacterized protein n=1 Tax=Periconia macrospinosa TaxID=97972 RepID=A0A2V1DXZ3_9PLEO|nr:hypothetical protein DM02DRAFT_704321 [Periconia macrospinosa]
MAHERLESICRRSICVARLLVFIIGRTGSVEYVYELCENVVKATAEVCKDIRTDAGFLSGRSVALPLGFNFPIVTLVFMTAPADLTNRSIACSLSRCLTCIENALCHSLAVVDKRRILGMRDPPAAQLMTFRRPKKGHGHGKGQPPPCLQK